MPLIDILIDCTGSECKTLYFSFRKTIILSTIISVLLSNYNSSTKYAYF